VEAKNTTAMLTTFNEVDMSNIMALRTKFKDKFKEKHGVNLGFMSFFTKACCYALQEWPAVMHILMERKIVSMITVIYLSPFLLRRDSWCL